MRFHLDCNSVQFLTNIAPLGALRIEGLFPLARRQRCGRSAA
jgi:hypothetical protein